LLAGKRTIANWKNPGVDGPWLTFFGSSSSYYYYYPYVCFYMFLLYTDILLSLIIMIYKTKFYEKSCFRLMGYLHRLQQQTMPPGATEEMPTGERRRAGRWAAEWIPIRPSRVGMMMGFYGIYNLIGIYWGLIGMS
jgi:hypothetical protein